VIEVSVGALLCGRCCCKLQSHTHTHSWVTAEGAAPHPTPATNTPATHFQLSTYLHPLTRYAHDFNSLR